MVGDFIYLEFNFLLVFVSVFGQELLPSHLFGYSSQYTVLFLSWNTKRMHPFLKSIHRVKSVKWLFGKNSHFVTFVPVHWFQIFLFPNGWWLSIMRKIFYNLLLKKCLRPCLDQSISLSKKINWIISSSVIVFQELFLFWVAEVILEGWEEELEWLHSFGIQPSKIKLWVAHT